MDEDNEPEVLGEKVNDGHRKSYSKPRNSFRLKEARTPSWVNPPLQYHDEKANEDPPVIA
jgi:hypothetical protein